MNDIPIELVESREANQALRAQLTSCKQSLAGHIAALLITSDRDSVRRAKELATELDGLGMNVDEEVESLLNADGYTYSRVVIPVGLDLESLIWTDGSRKAWDLSMVWVAKDGTSWAWTGYMDGRLEQPIMRKVDGGPASDAIFEAIEIFDGPLTQGGPRPAGFNR